MQLSVQERFALLSLLPEKGDFTTLKAVRELQDELSAFSDEEYKALKFQNLENNQVTWEQDADPLKEFAFGWKQGELIRDVLQKADKAKALKMEHMTLYEKFMEEKDGDQEKPVRIA